MMDVSIDLFGSYILGYADNCTQSNGNPCDERPLYGELWFNGTGQNIYE